MLKCALLLFLSLSLAWTFNIDDGCEVKSQWEIDYRWTSLNITSWVPYEEDGQILAIEIQLEDLKYPVNYDSLIISNGEIKFEKMRNGESEPERKPITNLKPGHWANFKFTVDTDYGFMALTTLNELLFKKKIENDPNKFIITGSSVTVDCRDSSRMWTVDDDKSPDIPLEDQSLGRFIFYSTKEFTAELELEKRKFSLGWQGGALTTIPEAGAIPRFEQHLVELYCRKEDKVKCDIKVGENRDMVEKDILMSVMPGTLTVRSGKGRFFVIEKGHEEMSKLDPEPMPEANTIHQNTSLYLSITAVVLILLVISVTVLAILYSKLKKKMAEKKLKEESQLDRIPANDLGSAENGKLFVELETLLAEANMDPSCSIP